MGPDFDHQLRQLRRSSRSLSAPGGVEAEVWRRIRLQEQAAGMDFLHLSAGLFRSSLLLAAILGFFIPWGIRGLSERESKASEFDSRLFSVHAPVLPSTRLGAGPGGE